MKRIISFLFLILLSVSFASAHQPRLVMHQNLSINSLEPYVIWNPEISQAFYGQLKNEPDYYIVYSNVSFEFYSQILSPYPEGSKNFSVRINGPFNSKNKISWPFFGYLDGPGSNWTAFYEDFAGDSYWQGPEIDKNTIPGVYLIEISSPDNSGEYSLAVGKIEAFPFKESMKALAVIPQIKKDFFGKSYLSVFEGKIFKYIGIGLLIILVLVVLAVFGARKVLRSKKIKNKKSKK